MRIENQDYGNWIEFELDSEKIEIRTDFETFTTNGMFGDDSIKKIA